MKSVGKRLTAAIAVALLGAPWLHMMHRRASADHRSLVIMTVSKVPCADVSLPVPGFCLEGCPAKEEKMHCILTGLRELTSRKAASHVLLADNDVLFGAATAKDFFDAFDNYDVPIVVSAERHLFKGIFRGKIEYELPNGENLYANSGVIMGELSATLFAYEEMYERMADLNDKRAYINERSAFSPHLTVQHWIRSDQTLTNQLVNREFNKLITLDHRRQIAYTLLDLLRFPCRPRKGHWSFLNETADIGSFCQGYFQEQGLKLSDPIHQLRKGVDRFCRPVVKKGRCFDQIGLDDSCKIYVHTSPIDSYSSGVEKPLVLHFAGKGYGYKTLARKLQLQALDRCAKRNSFAPLSYGTLRTKNFELRRLR